MRRSLGFVVGALLLALAGCAPRTAVLPVVTTPGFPDFMQPRIPLDLAGSPSATSTDRAWQFLQAGDLRGADREIAAALKQNANFYPAETVAAYVDLARKDGRAAVARFDRVLARRSDYLSALVGRGQALESLGRDDDAIQAFQAALALDPSLPDIGRRVEVLKFRTVQRAVVEARQAAQAGRTDEAVRAYQSAIASSPESAFLYRELAAIERDRGDEEGALGHYRRAAALDPGDSASLLGVAEILDARNDFDAAIEAYGAALAIDPDPAVSARRDAVRARAEAAALPAEYRAIQSAAQITRGDLAALVGVRLGSLLQATRGSDIGVITDIRGNWAEPWILAVARAGVMDPYANHTFQPRNVVRRVDFAQAVTKLLAKVAVIAPAQAARWQNARGRFPDITASHLAYPAASAATASGVMTTGPGGSFQPSQVVTGAEAIEALDRLRALTRTPAAPGAAR